MKNNFKACFEGAGCQSKGVCGAGVLHKSNIMGFHGPPTAPKRFFKIRRCSYYLAYEFRQLATARDPLAVVEAHRLNICLRLAWLLGVRMCPQCPRCNDGKWGCSDLYGIAQCHKYRSSIQVASALWNGTP